MENENKESIAPIIGPIEPVSTGEWMWTILVSGIPVIGLIMLFVWAFNKSENPSKANWAKASLVWMAIMFVLMIIFFSIFINTISNINS